MHGEVLDMVKIRKGGMLYTLTITLFIFVLFSLSMLAKDYSEMHSASFISLSRFIHFQNMDSSVQDSVRRIFFLGSGINITVSGLKVEIEDSLPNEKISAFNSWLDTFKSYVESEEDSISLDFAQIKDRVPLRIMPHNITYLHTSADKVEIIPHNIMLNDYSLTFYMSQNITSCTFNTKAGSFRLHVKGIGLGGSGCEEIRYIDAIKNNVILVNGGNMNMRIQDNRIEVNANTQLLLHSIFSLLDIGHETVNIVLPEALSINSNNISKTSADIIII